MYICKYCKDDKMSSCTPFTKLFVNILQIYFFRNHTKYKHTNYLNGTINLKTYSQYNTVLFLSLVLSKSGSVRIIDNLNH